MEDGRRDLARDSFFGDATYVPSRIVVLCQKLCLVFEIGLEVEPDS